MARLLIVEDHPELASLMVAAAESRGHEARAVHTGEAALALLAPAAFDAAIVDLLLPDMRGSTVLSALRDNAIPAVAMSGVFKGDRFAREATEVHGARAFFEKPFELLQLLGSVEQLCGLTHVYPPPPPYEDEEVVVLEDSSLLDDEPIFDSAEEEPVFLPSDEDEPVFSPSEDEPVFAPSELEPVVQGQVLAEDVQEPAPAEEVTVRGAEALPPEEEGEEAAPAPEAPAPITLEVPDDVSQALARQAEESVAAEQPAPAEGPEPGLALPFAEREKVWSKTGKVTPLTRRRTPPEWTLSGDLRDTSIPRLLNAYYEARHSGELKLRQGSIQKVIYFTAGCPVFAASNLTHERFARFCVRRGVLPEARLAEVATLVREQKLRTAEALTRLGLLSEPQRQQLVEEQVREILYSTLGWSEGAYGFSPLRPPSTGLVKLSVFPGDLILEGVLKAETLVSLRRNMAHSRRLFPSAAPPYGLHELKLQGQQALLLAYADGSKTVEDLLALTELPEREVLATLRGLELLGVLEERREEPASRSRISFGL